jgi:hypothetical protein
MKHQVLVIGLLLPATALAQFMMSASGGGGGTSFTGSATFTVRALTPQAVTGAPYSGQQSNEQVQTLSDGTHITNSHLGPKEWRDSKGRTRSERPLFPGGPVGSNMPQITLVEISDPVAGYHYVLDTQNKVAYRIAMSLAASAPPTSKAPSMSASGFAGSIPATIGGALGNPPVPPAAVVTGGIGMGVGGGVGLGGAFGSSRAGSPGARPEFKKESLGTKMIDGVTAEGTRNVMTYDTGSVGNDRPFSVITESWYSPDLKLALVTVTHDPRSGDNTFRIANLIRVEPDLTLFTPPPGYMIVDETDTFTIHYTGQ